MTIKYEDRQYRVTLQDYIFIQWNKSLMFITRQYRRLKILFRKQDIILYTLISLFWVMFGFVKYTIGQSFIATEEIPYTISNVLWDLSQAWFTSVILSFVIGAYTRIGEYTKKIRNQHDIYVSSMTDFESIVYRYIGSEKYNYFPLYCRKCLDDTVLYIKSKARTVNCSLDDDMVLSLDIILDRLKLLDELIKANSFVFYGEPLTLNQTNELRRIITEYVVKKKINANAVVQLMESFYMIVEKIRQPWRYDIQLKMKVLERLNKYPENEIMEDFYYKMLLQGHSFPNTAPKLVDSENVKLLLHRLRANHPSEKE